MLPGHGGIQLTGMPATAMARCCTAEMPCMWEVWKKHMASADTTCKLLGNVRSYLQTVAYHFSALHLMYWWLPMAQSLLATPIAMCNHCPEPPKELTCGRASCRCVSWCS